ncbi:acyl-CoA dehydrogenase family protein [Actinoplanes aureus]|uniref:Acyl-CoA/acyl-ACP dehydrogenase n=1 Tax=Actinoplanes aureus TaxID=2792083 RepID=A0A931CHH9_9ACTN|nr:acyl-CoA dehydrogenase family protein [Actinoplanes aureus]MBG0565030.1 acyl-CoA/acyl-ACP dehydrogenase [Actinoplanes aureus]
MDFRPDEAQQAIIRLTGEVLDGNPDAPEKAWADLGRAGLLSLAVPARLGGAGFGALETALVLTEIGRRAVDVPAFQTLALGVLPVARWGTEQQQDELLTDGRTFTAAIAEPGDPLPAAPRTLATPDWQLTGVKTGVTEADHILVTVSTEEGPAVAIIDPATPGVSREGQILRLDQAQARPLGEDRPQARPPGKDRAQARHDGASRADCHADLHRYARSGACALADGALAGALALTADHVRTRHQFGRPLATFQAVAQQIADVYIASRTLHVITLAAAWRLGAGRPADDDLAVAAQWLTAEALPAVRTCHHLHGGLGLVADYPLHRHTTLLRDMVRFLGGREHCVEALGKRVGAPCSST